MIEGEQLAFGGRNLDKFPPRLTLGALMVTGSGLASEHVNWRHSSNCGILEEAIQPEVMQVRTSVIGLDKAYHCEKIGIGGDGFVLVELSSELPIYHGHVERKWNARQIMGMEMSQ